ncbi:hypothetical protein E3N88_05324 [Mikania micrantha]|uniref:Uncharacterized protein n=1 Tax=Mikania micrantha TaxID=192012 RepID=A0A5N6PKN9_9ASTR|nr:hypothetical protein E3N88_05324 [Mikania micrantha]
MVRRRSLQPGVVVERKSRRSQGELKLAGRRVQQYAVKLSFSNPQRPLQVHFRISKSRKAGNEDHNTKCLISKICKSQVVQFNMASIQGSDSGWVGRKPLRRLGGMSDALSIAADLGFTVAPPPSQVNFDLYYLILIWCDYCLI